MEVKTTINFNARITFYVYARNYFIINYGFAMRFISKKIKLIHNWRLCWKRYSTYLILAIPVLDAARDFLPQVQEVISPDLYKRVSAGLAIAAFIAIQIKQNSLSGATTDEQNTTDKTA